MPGITISRDRTHRRGPARRHYTAPFSAVEMRPPCRATFFYSVKFSVKLRRPVYRLNQRINSPRFARIFIAFRLTLRHIDDR